VPPIGVRKTITISDISQGAINLYQELAGGWQSSLDDFL